MEHIYASETLVNSKALAYFKKSSKSGRFIISIMYHYRMNKSFMKNVLQNPGEGPNLDEMI
jgi:hypothetical protein